MDESTLTLLLAGMLLLVAFSGADLGILGLGALALLVPFSAQHH
ncbi:MAG: hypothetical protein Q8P02_01810 [Candidatus Micrarchaeota archaeon]|nr:hypothetical protein [Candidatus Micrarchaeota archaeon]